jgi:predicted esterase
MSFHKLARLLLGVALVLGLLRPLAAENSILLRNGFVLRGNVIEIASLDGNAFASGAGEVSVRPIWMVDDKLRRVYVHQHGMVVPDGVNEAPDPTQRIELWQPTAPLNATMGAGIGGILGVSSFNEKGRRKVQVRGPEGKPLTVVQGLTEITARYAKVEGLKASPSYQWDMRIATDSIPPDELRRVFYDRLKPLTLDVRLELIRFYIEAEQFGEARREMEAAIAAFPETERLTEQLGALVQRQAGQLLEEAKLRKDAGQVKLAMEILRNFPLNEVARVMRLEVEEVIAEIAQEQAAGSQLVDRLTTQIGQLEPPRAEPLQPLLQEIQEGISLDTIARLSDYRRLGGEENLPLENRVALALGGWMLGSGSGLQNLAVATSMIEVRRLVAEYLGTADLARRQAILDELRQLEGADPASVASMLPLLPPPLPLPEPAAEPTEDDAPEDPAAKDLAAKDLAAKDPPGLYRVTTAWAAGPPVDYLVQLPPEYNPLRSYPAVVTLHAPGGTPEAQLAWWCGPYHQELKMRMGQAARHGYVVVAPAWTRPGQSLYEYTTPEHHRVLAAVRDAMRRVSIDADRVFLSGHGEGASAAWDIALAHPDIWAGLLAVGAEARKYVKHYHPNGTELPMYFVMGEIAGAPDPLMRNGATLDRYMNPKYNAMVVMYRGRGGEHFFEEIHHFFDWMNLRAHRRPAPPQEIDMVTMRKHDRFFWWLEMPAIEDQVTINPILWDQQERKRAAPVRARVNANNSLIISSGPAEAFIVWLAPSMGLNLNEPIVIRHGSGRSERFHFDGSVDVLLEDARTRGDRQQPYWAKVQIP